MKILVLISLVFITGTTYSQIYSSSCLAPDSIIELYRNDADRLAVTYFFDNEMTNVDSVTINQDFTNVFLDALISVYNAVNMPEHEEVIENNTIHTLIDYGLRSILIASDGDSSWMMNLENGIIPSGNNELDELLENHQLNSQDYLDFSDFLSYDIAVFYAENNINISALVELFSEIEDINYAESNAFSLDGNDIYGFIHNDYVELVYSIGLGDCPSGCM